MVGLFSSNEKLRVHLVLIARGLDQARFPSYIGMMAKDVETRNGMWGWGIGASFLIHGLIAFIILVGIPFELPKPEAEEVVSVEIVPPEQEKAAEEPQPAPPEEAKEEAQQQPPPPPPPPAAESSPPPPPAAEAPEAPENAGAGQPLNAFRPVVEFGDKDAGPERADDGASADKGDAAEEPSEAEQAQRVEMPPQAETEPENAAARDAPQADAEMQANEREIAKNEDSAEVPGAPVPEDVTVPDVGLGPTAGDGDGIPVPVPAPREEVVNAEMTAANPSESKEADDQAKPVQQAALPKAGQLFSPSVTDNPMATIAMGNMSRGERAAELCNTELREQLRHGSPSYQPNLLPKPRLASGNVIDARSIGFRARDQWYDVSFRCEVDGQAMKVVSFAHQVGGAIPKSEWRKRGFPAY